MPDQQDTDRKNDTRLLTPLLLMALLIVCGFLFYTFVGHAPTAASLRKRSNILRLSHALEHMRGQDKPLEG